ncbi:MAG: hypothetical protein HY725_03520 [Candidatus Rokubacteria bacterium]|nr:hypothetical protein [Candidatus Rokubacteria bacterium]
MPQAFGWFKKPIKRWADLKGIKFRIPGIGVEILKEAGMAVVTLPGGEIVPAAERRKAIAAGSLRKLSPTTYRPPAEPSYEDG